MTTAGTVTVDVTGRDVNLQALLARVDAQMRQTNQAGLQLTQTTGTTFTAAQQRAANATIQEAQAMARAAVAVGDNARAHQILVNALGNSAGATDRAVAGLTAQIGRLQSGTTIASQFTDSLKSGLAGIIGPAAAAGAALSALREIPALIQLGAQAEQTRVRFDQLAQQAGTTGEAFTAALRQASGGTIADTNLQLSAMKANLLGVASSAEQLGPLLAIARDRAQQMGISTEFAFDSLVTGLGRGSRLILDNIGVIVKESEVNEAYAKSVGKTVAALTDQEKKQALINEVLRQGQETIAATGGAVETTATKIERMNANLTNLKTNLGGLTAEALGPAIEGLTRLTGGDIDAMTASLNNLGVVGQTALGAFSGAMPAVNAGLQSMQVAADQAASGLERNAAASDFASNTNRALSTAYVDVYSAATQTAQAAQDLAAKTEEDAAKAQLAAVQAETLAIKKNELAQQAQIAAQALIASGQAGEATAGRLAASSSLVDQLTAAYYRLAAAQQAAAVQSIRQGALNAGIATRSAADETKLDGIRARSSANATNAAQRYNSMLDAQRDRINTVGTAQERVAQAERDLAAARSKFGDTSAEAYRAETKLLQAQEAATRAQRKGAGAAKLSDQQKLNNQLLTDQERYQDQAEQAEREHGRRLLDIDREFQKRQLEQARRNQISKRQSELDFLKSITDSELNATKEGRAEVARINAQYYADFEEAQKAAQAGNLKQSEELVEQARRRAQVEQEYAEQIAAARKAKDADEVRRLEALREKERQLLDEQKKQILEGGDENMNQRNEALAEEERRYAEQQGKIGDSAESAAERKVNAAIRAGKAVEDENVKLREQEAILGRIGSRGTPGAAGGASATPGTPTEGLTGEDIKSRLQAIVDAIHTEGGRITGAVQDTTGAVRGIGPRLAGA